MFIFQLASEIMITDNPTAVFLRRSTSMMDTKLLSDWCIPMASKLT